MAGKIHFPQTGGYASAAALAGYLPVGPFGNVFFVNSVTGTDTLGFGFSPEAPFKTLAFALGTSNTNLTADNDDVVFAMPLHAETVTGAAGIAVAKSGVSVVGVGNGRTRPTVTFTTAVGASFDVTGSNVLIKNLVLKNGFDNQTAIHNVTGSDVTFDGCEYAFSDGTNGAALGILTAATANRLVVKNCRFLGPALNAGTILAAAIQHESGVDYVIQGNHFIGKATQMILNVATVLRGLIDNNRFVVGTGTAGITMAAASTPFITNNQFNVASGTAPIVAAAGFVANNVYSAAAGVTAGTAKTF